MGRGDSAPSSEKGSRDGRGDTWVPSRECRKLARLVAMFGGFFPVETALEETGRTQEL